MQEKRAIVTLNIGDKNNKLFSLTRPVLERYARRTGADFIVIDERKINRENVDFEKYQVYELLDKYDRVLFLDADIIVAPECPDLFNIVPKECFGAYVLYDDYFKDIKECQDKCGDIGWGNGVFNAGVMLVSGQHREAFNPFSPVRYFHKWFLITFEINYKVQALKIKIFDIKYNFNHCSKATICGGTIRKDLSRFNSFIIHYAGGREYKDARISDIKWDLRILALPKFTRKSAALLVLAARMAAFAFGRLAYRLKLFKISLMRLRKR
jgi:hypothetical protein